MSSNSYAKRSQMAPAAALVRAYAAPINRVTGAIAAFDPARRVHSISIRRLLPGSILAGSKTSSAPPPPSTTLCAPALPPTSRFSTALQPEARVEFDLLTWGKLQMALSGGTQQLNVLAEQPGLLPQPSGGMALPASPVQSRLHVYADRAHQRPARQTSASATSLRSMSITTARPAISAPARPAPILLRP